jgi:hypothetical protein
MAQLGTPSPLADPPHSNREYSKNGKEMDGIVLEHMSVEPIRELRYVQQRSAYSKPLGLWLSYPGEWVAWCGALRSDYWFGHMRLDPQQIERKPWSQTGAHRVALLDLSDRAELTQFISKFKAEGYRYRVDWSHVSQCFGGVFIIGTSKLDQYYGELNNSDGCWILSIDVDSACLWDPQVMSAWLNTDHEPVTSALPK